MNTSRSTGDRGMTFSPHSTKSKMCCCVAGCRSNTETHPTVLFHSLPRVGQTTVLGKNSSRSVVVDRREYWENVLKLPKNVNHDARVCSLHFEEEEYFIYDRRTKSRCLRKCALPKGSHERRKWLERSTSKINEVTTIPETILPTSEIVYTNNAHKTETEIEMREVNNECNVQVKSETDMDIGNYECNIKEEVDIDNGNLEASIPFEAVLIKTELPTEPVDEDSAAQATKPGKDAEVQVKPPISQQFPFESFIKKSIPQPLVKDAEVQVNTDSFVWTILHNIKTDHNLRVATGIASFDVLNTIVRRAIETFGNKYEHLNFPMNTRDRVIMTYMKCKHNLSFSFLSILFQHYTPTHLQRIFVETLQILGKCSKNGIPTISLNQIPQKLRQHYLINQDSS